MNPNAINALGWIALEKERNYTKANEMFQQSYKRGIPDSGYYLGFMALHGLIPKEKKDVVSHILSSMEGEKGQNVNSKSQILPYKFQITDSTFLILCGFSLNFK